MPWATVFANVWLPLRLRGVSRGGAEAADRRGARRRSASPVSTRPIRANSPAA